MTEIDITFLAIYIFILIVEPFVIYRMLSDQIYRSKEETIQELKKEINELKMIVNV